MLGDDCNKSKPASGGKEEEIELGKYLLLFSPEPFVFSSTV
jgi:hypothetical protein